MIKVYAPASIGNVGVGFDTLGLAIKPMNGNFLGDCIIMEDSDTFKLENVGAFKKQLPIQLEQNIVFQCWKKFCEILGKLCPVSIQLEKNIPVASGLGSSASSIVASLVAMNYHFGNPLNNDQLLILMGEMEEKFSGSVHFDNVAPCFLGGMRLIFQDYTYQVSQIIPSFEHWLWIVAYPGIMMSTEKSRSILPKKYDRDICIAHSRYLSGFIHACHTNQEFLAIRNMQDVIAEPYRSQLLPIELSYLRHVLMQKGAISCGISGSGSTIFVLCNTEKVTHDIYNWLSQFYLQNSLGFIQACHVDQCGARIIAG